MDRSDYKAEDYAEEGKGMVTRSMAARKEQGQEKSSGFYNTMKSALNSATANMTKMFRGSNENNEDEIKEEPTGPAVEEDEQITEVQFASLLESISEDEIVVR